jgi:hypothetical protein
MEHRIQPSIWDKEETGVRLHSSGACDNKLHDDSCSHNKHNDNFCSMREIGWSVEANLLYDVKMLLQRMRGVGADKISKSQGPTYITNAIITLTQEEYDALESPDPNTLYFIVA